MTETSLSPVTTPIPDKPTSRRRLLGYASLPVILVALLTAGIRLAADAEKQQDAADIKSTRVISREDRKRMPTLPPYNPASKATEAAVKKVITGQLDALATKDYARALTFAITPMRKMTPVTFERIVEQGYGAMTRSQSIVVSPVQTRYKPLSVPNGTTVETATATATVVTNDGETTEFVYQLVKEKERWCIDGVFVKPAPSPSDESSRLTVPRYNKNIAL